MVGVKIAATLLKSFQCNDCYQSSCFYKINYVVASVVIQIGPLSIYSEFHIISVSKLESERFLCMTAPRKLIVQNDNGLFADMELLISANFGFITFTALPHGEFSIIVKAYLICTASQSVF